MKYRFTEERTLTEWVQWEVEAESLEKACKTFPRRRQEDFEAGEIVDSDIHHSMLVEVSDETGEKYNLELAEEFIDQAE